LPLSFGPTVIEPTVIPTVIEPTVIEGVKLYVVTSGLVKTSGCHLYRTHQT
jgi:hypothetical protein